MAQNLRCAQNQEARVLPRTECKGFNLQIKHAKVIKPGDNIITK